jgi:hypothetical protein
MNAEGEGTPSSLSVPTVVFELSVVNADKPSMTTEEVCRRVNLFRELQLSEDIPEETNWGVLLTAAPLFTQKLDVLRSSAPYETTTTTFPSKYPFDEDGHRDSTSLGWSFIIGTDTMIRILDPKYYDHDEEKMIGSLRNMNIKFVVGGRKIDQTTAVATQEFVTGEESLQGLPQDVQDMFIPLDETEFRVDVSSTEIRERQQQSQQQQQQQQQN